MLKITGLRKSYSTAEGPVEVLRGVGLELARGESLALTGESGSGKSTLLHLVAGLDRMDGGEILVAGQALSGLGDAALAGLRRDRIGLVFQQFNLIPSLDVGANIALQARLCGRHDLDWTQELAGVLGLTGLLHRYPEALSGGQQQRVAIGRALAGRPGLILADEPTGNLDEAAAERVMAVMLNLVRQTGASLLMVTHSDRLAGRLDRRLHLAAGQVSP